MERGKHASVLLVGGLALKWFRPGFAANAAKEFRYLKQLEPYGMAPRPFFRLGRLLAMERVRGRRVRDMDDGEVRGAAPEFLRALHLLDRLGIKKEECHRPDKHFWMTPGGRVKLIDFERAHPGDGNVTQFMHFLRRFYPGITDLGPAYKRTKDLKPVLDFIGSS